MKRLFNSQRTNRRQLFNCVRLEDRTVPATMFAVDLTNNLISFDSATPGTTATNPITGLGASEFILGLDFRPATGGLYGLGITDNGVTRTGQLYLINSSTASASAVGTPFSTTLPDNTFWGFDFNPNVDRIRVTNNSNQNLRLNPNTGAIAATDSDLNPGNNIDDVAYTNSAGELATTTLYGLRFSNNTLITIGGLNGTPSPNTGETFEIGPLGIVSNDGYFFDIEAGSNTGRFYTRVLGVSQLYTVDLGTGTATLVGTIAGNPVLRGLTSASSAITVGGTAGDDTVVVNALDANSGSYTLNGGTPVPFVGITSFSFIGGAGSDKLTINNPAGGLFAPTDSIFFHGGGQANDVLENVGGTADFGSFTSAPSNGAGSLVHISGSTAQSFTMTGMSGFTDIVSESTFEINGTSGADTFDLTEGVVQSGVQLSQVSFTPANLASIAIQFGNKPTFNIFALDGTDSFIVNGTSSTTNLFGGDADDRLQFVNTTKLATLSGGSYDGGTGIDSIEYTGTPSAVRVNLGLSNNMTASLDGTQENPAITTTATATGTVTYDPSNLQVTIVLTVNNMLNKISDFHIHLNPSGINGGIIVPIGAGVFTPTGTAGQFTVDTTVTLPELNEAAFLGGGTYLNIHTDVNKGGEIRGQILAGTNVNLTSGFASGTASITDVENVLGTDSNDSIVGNNLANNLNGAGGNDFIVGGPGADTFIGGDGNDTLVWNNGDGSDKMDGGNNVDTVQVNGNVNAETFTLGENSGRAEFKRTSAGPFTLDIGTTETLRLNANSGDDAFNVTGLTTSGTGLATVQGFGFNGNDSFTVTNTILTGGLRFNGHLGVNTLQVLSSTVAGAVSNSDGIVGNGIIGEFLDAVALTASTFVNNAQSGVRLANVGFVSLHDLTLTNNAGQGVSIAKAGNVDVTGTLVGTLNAPTGIDFTGPLTYRVNAEGTAPGQFDQIVAGSVTLGNATLDFVPAFTVPGGTTLRLIDNTGANAVTGTFAGLPEGSVFFTSGQSYIITYKGGTGNDVVLQAAIPPQFTSASALTVTRNQQFTFTVTATGIPPASITISGGLPSGVTYVNNNNGTGTLSGKTNESGTFDVGFTASNGAGTAVQFFRLVVSEQIFAVGAGPGRTPDVNVYNSDGTLKFTFLAYDKSFTGGVNVATADYNNDGIDDIITAAASNGGPHVKVFDGKNMSPLASFFAYDASFTGGVFVAAADINGDGFGDIITGANAGGGPHVKVFASFILLSGSFPSRSTFEERSFFAYDAAFVGGVRVAAGDVDNNGTPDIITGAGPGGGPHVQAFSGVGNARIRSFFAYDSKFSGGVFVASGDVNGDGADDIITGADAGGGPHVLAYSGLNLATLQTFYAFDATFTGGVRVAADDLNGDGRADIITGAGPGGTPHVVAYSGANLAQLESFFAFDPSFLGGVYVG